MLLEKMNWMDVEKYTRHDTRIVFVLGATEQHGYLSLLTDSLIPWQIAQRACEEEKVMLAPILYYGFSHWALDYPGTMSISSDTYDRVIKDLIASALRSGFRNFLFLNGHSGNRGAREAATQAVTDCRDVRVWFYAWWEFPKTAAYIASKGGMQHANWAENFPFTRVCRVPDKTAPSGNGHYRRSAAQWRADYPEGVMGGKYQVEDEISTAIIDIAVSETRTILQEMALPGNP